MKLELQMFLFRVTLNIEILSRIIIGRIWSALIGDEKGINFEQILCLQFNIISAQRFHFDIFPQTFRAIGRGEEVDII